MKGTGPFFATVLAASALALTSSSSAGLHSVSFSPSSPKSNQGAKNGASRNCTASETEKFAPRFDGLRFIETLVTAHR